MTEDTSIRRMTPQDLDEVLEIEQGSFEDPWSVDVFTAELRHSWSHCDVLTDGEGGRVLGYVVFWSVADEVHLLNVAVDPRERHHQHGRHLLDHMIDYARGETARRGRSVLLD